VASASFLRRLQSQLFAGKELILKSIEALGGAVLRCIGLPEAGKTTIARALCECFHSGGILAVLLDGEVLRHRLNAGLGFNADDLRRGAHVAQVFGATSWRITAPLRAFCRMGSSRSRRASRTAMASSPDHQFGDEQSTHPARRARQ
jgi:adenylylsulfate kinase-like enzyme